jgi:hypothetical protein
MFVGWIRDNSIHEDIEHLSKEILIDTSLVLNTIHTDMSLCFGAYEEHKLNAIITAFEFEKHILINGFYYLPFIDTQIKTRLLQILIDNIPTNKSIQFLANETEVKLFEKFGFAKHQKFFKATYNGGAGAFNFSNATAKSINKKNFAQTVRKYDTLAMGDDRYEYILSSMMKNSSLVLSTDFGFMHSYAISKGVIKISPWIMHTEVFTDSEKLLRGVIYHRGLKKLLTFVPSANSDAVELYKKYKFSLEGSYYLLFKNERPSINTEHIYGI